METSRHDAHAWSRSLADQLVATILDDGAALLRWLDVGLAHGDVVASALAAGVERVDAVDPEPERITEAAERFDRSVVGLRVGTVPDLGGFVGPYDTVVASLTLARVTEPVAAMRRMREVLGYGGTAWAVVWDETAGDGIADPRVAPLTSADGLGAAAGEAGWTGEVRVLEVAGPDGAGPRRALAVTTEP